MIISIFTYLFYLFIYYLSSSYLFCFISFFFFFFFFFFFKKKKRPVPIDQNIKCTLIRSKMKNVPSYELYIENTDSTFSPLLYSRKVRIGNHSEYVITKKIFTTSVPEESEIIGRLK